MKYLSTVIVIVMSILPLSAQTDSTLKDQAIAQMNYHVLSMTRIIHDRTLQTLDYELDQLLNNLTVEHIVTLPEIKEFRSSLMRNIHRFQLTAHEKELMNKIFEIQRKNMVWEATSNALNSTMILTNTSSAKQAAFYGLLSIARGAVDYNVRSNQQNIEELKAMWELKKVDLKTINDLRVDAFSTIYNIYKRFNLKEENRLVESDAELFADIIYDTDEGRQLRRLIDNKEKFKNFTDYDYYLGMSLLSVKGYEAAQPYLKSYIRKYDKSPMFRANDKSAFVYLSQLAYEELSHEQADSLLKKVINIIPNNGVAMIQSSLTYLEYDMKQEAFNLLRKCLDNPLISDKGSIVMLLSSLKDEISAYPDIWQSIRESIYSLKGLDINSYLAFINIDESKNIFSELQKIIKIKRGINKKAFFKSSLDDEIDLQINNSFIVDLSSVDIYYETVSANSITINQNRKEFTEGTYNRSFLMEKISYFQSNPSLIYNFFTSMESEDVFCIRKDIDISKNINEYEGMELCDRKTAKKLKRILKSKSSDNYTIKSSSPDKNVLIKVFNLDHINTTEYWKELNYIPFYGSYKNLKAAYNRYKVYSASTDMDTGKWNICFKGDSLKYAKLPEFEQEKTCFRVVFDGMAPIIVTYIYDNVQNMIIPFSVNANGKEKFINPSSLVSYIPETKHEKQEAWWQKLMFWKKKITK